jgi:head-tail adaptor
VTGIGDLDRRLVLEAPADIDDGAGGVTRSYAAATTLWAQVVPVRARPDAAADSLAALVTHRIVIRAGQALTTLHRFRDGARIFEIVSFRGTPDRRFVAIEAVERV